MISFPQRLGLFALALAAAILWMSWPLPTQLGELLTSGRADGDLGYTLSAHWWAGEVLSGQASFPINDRVYFPQGQNMAGSVWNFVPLFLSAWTHWFLDPLSAYNLAILFLMALNGVAAALLGMRLGGSWGALGGACAILAFPFPWAEAFEGRLEQAFLAPPILVFWAAIPFRESPQAHARTLGLLMGLVATCYWFYAPIVSLGLGLYLGRSLRCRTTLRALATAFGFSLLAAFPLFLLIVPALEGGAFVQATSDTQHILFTRVGQSLSPWESFSGWLGPDNLGRTLPLSCTICMVFISIKCAKARPWMLVALCGALFAMGPVLSHGNEPWVTGGRMIPLPFALLDGIPGLARFWWPYRFLALVGIAGVACMAILFSRLSGSPRRFAPLLLALLFLVEGRLILANATQKGDPSIPASSWDPEPHGHFFKLELPDWIQSPPESGAMLEFPMSAVANSAPLYAPFHQLPTAHGDGIREAHIRPKAFEERVRSNPILAAWARGSLPQITDEPLDELYRLGFRHIVIHTDPSGFSASSQEEGALVSRFQAAIGPPTHEESRLRVFAIPSPRSD